jgi:prophage maintenance system killer protein
LVCAMRVCWWRRSAGRGWRFLWQRRHTTVLAAYLCYLSRAHAFVDANKWTTLACTLIWLAPHNLQLTLSPTELTQGLRSLDNTVWIFESTVIHRF